MELLTYKDTFAALLAALAGFLVVHWQRARMRPASVPPLGTNWPVIGMLPTLICQMVNFHDYLAERLIKHGGTVEMQGLWFSDMDSIITSDPANIRHIMSCNFRNYPKGPIMKEIF
ncbi:unnamed protein product [Linum trigynum]|uniref:Cytochrome P450 n=1 Tax=Linum trigynum TaxID=586398 RepID=A0AAV2FJW0_9ROSI